MLPFSCKKIWLIGKGYTHERFNTVNKKFIKKIWATDGGRKHFAANQKKYNLWVAWPEWCWKIYDTKNDYRFDAAYKWPNLF